MALYSLDVDLNMIQMYTRPRARSSTSGGVSNTSSGDSTILSVDQRQI